MSLLLLILIALATPALAHASDSVKVDPEAPCAVCHEDVAALRTPASDVHAGLPCDACHPGRAFNPHVPPEIDTTEREEAARFAAVAEHSPAAYAACSACHPDAVAAWQESVHGRDSGVEGRPSCQSCHGSIHAVAAGSRARRERAARCIACHSFAGEGAAAAGPNVVDTYRDTIHGKLLALGNDRAAACPDCHAGHAVFPPGDPRSTVYEANRVATCAKCHAGANPSFVAAISHRSHTVGEDFWGAVTSMGFSLLTLGVMLLLFLHVMLDAVRTGQQALTGGGEPSFEADGPVDADQPVPRFDVHMRLQHWGLMLSFVLLVVTGWPLKAASVGAAASLAHLLGGQPALAAVHRAAGVLLIAVSLYHLGYLLYLSRKGAFSLSMLPTPKDVSDLFGNLMYFFGLRPERPSFGRWTYFEKFDYWAVFWGMVIMAGSGLLLWFPEAAGRLVPGRLIAIAHIAHSDEALLALLAIFLWHFYNVHLRPTVFPMSWVWLSGRIPAEALYEDHRAEYERLYGRRAPRPSPAHGLWYRKPGWSYAMLTLVLAAAAAVLVGNVAQVRDRIAAMQEPGEGHVATRSRGPASAAATGPPGVYAADFDAFARCFACHNHERYELGAGFPHKVHLETLELGECKDCHTAVWHESMTASTGSCLTCHEAEAIGLRQDQEGISAPTVEAE